MPRRIICGIDGSERTYEAVAVAWDLSQRLGHSLMLVHVAEDPPGFPFGEAEAMQRDRQQREAHAAVLLRDVSMTFDLPPETALRAELGDPATMLRTLVAEEDPAMLVVASRGRGRIRSALFGSVTAQLADGLGCPLMVVAPAAGTRYRQSTGTPDATVVCGIDSSTRVESLLPQADRLASSLRARLLILHAELPAMTTSRGAYPTAGVSMAGAPMILHEHVEEQEHVAHDQLERARELATETSQVEVRAELGDLATAMAGLGEASSVQALVIAQDSAWQRVAARAGCPVLLVPE